MELCIIKFIAQKLTAIIVSADVQKKLKIIRYTRIQVPSWLRYVGTCIREVCSIILIDTSIIYAVVLFIIISGIQSTTTNKNKFNYFSCVCILISSFVVVTGLEIEYKNNTSAC